jgi:hypothetical protein
LDASVKEDNAPLDPFHLQENAGHVVETIYKEIARNMQKKEETKDTISIPERKERPPWKEVEIIVFLASSAMGCGMNDE